MARETREVWAKRVERWRDSGLSLKEFAAEIGVNANTLAGWRWRLGAGGGVEPRKVTPAVPAFLEVVAGPATAGKFDARVAKEGAIGAVPPDAGDPLELVLRSGHRVHVPVLFDAATLRRVVDVLEGR